MENLKIYHRITLNGNDITSTLDYSSYVTHEIYHKIVKLSENDTYTVWSDTDTVLNPLIAAIVIVDKNVNCIINGNQIHDLTSGFLHVFNNKFANTNVETIQIKAIESDTRVEVIIV